MSSLVTKLRGRPSKHKSRCPWCEECKVPLKFVFPTDTDRKAFCSEVCLTEFRKAYIACPNGQVEVRELTAKTESLNTETQDTNSNDMMAKLNRKLSSSEIKKKAGTDKTQLNSIMTTNDLSPSPTYYMPANHQPFFEWDAYLKETNSEPAPVHYFKQYADPPLNNFEKDMKLEAKDPRNLTSTCIATVIHKIGPRLRLRLDGGDNKNDFWRLVDSDEINMIGNTEKNKGMLQPPLGFRSNPSTWPMFLMKTLNGAVMAPQNVFIQEPPTPSENLFKIGQKLEAVDKKNPFLICAATIAKVEDDEITISFDGWKGAFGYTCKYYSRDIFPVGWCKKSGHPLQPPGHKIPVSSKNKSRMQSVSQTVQNSNVVVPTPASLSPHITLIEADTTIIPRTENQVCVYVNSECNCGPYLDPSKMSQIPLTFGPGTIKRVLRESIQHLVDASHNQKQVTDMLKQGEGKVIITALYDKKSSHCRLPEIEKEGEFWSYITNYLEYLECCENLFCSAPLSGQCPKCLNSATTIKKGIEDKNLSTKIKKSNDDIIINNNNNNNNDNNNISSIVNKRRYSPESSSPPTPQSTNLPKGNVIISSAANSKKLRKSVPEQEAATSTTPAEIPPKLPSDPADWSIENVISYISYCDPLLGIHADLFRRHEIDGKALLLLNSDTMMKYMGLKLGPALKICNLVSKIKTRRHILL